ncbi:MAG TPA: sporulation histidine kinase inhibitor Sda [Pseudogracilibacillus sp.]|nr:sporulation histidine kinase inhibitor Sda [Pseudogracilibacillus sp.]
MDTFRTLTDEQLIEAYQEALTLSLNSDFINLLKKELQRRNISNIPYIHFQ